MTAGGFVGFTDAEKKEIEEALAAAGLPTRDSRLSLGERLEVIAAYCSGAYTDPRIERRRCEEAIAKLNDELRIIEMAIDIHLSHKEEYVSSKAEAAPHAAGLLRDLLYHLLSERDNVWARLELLDPTPGNNHRPFQDWLQSFVASIWMDAGGEINGRKEYRRFFQAIVRPILTNRRIRTDYGVALAESTFQDHVKTMKERALPF